jgi:predicted TIM-barrel fold metal-dependent hydrolase
MPNPESATDEAALDPDRPIIDPHLHLWDILAAPGLPQQPMRFLFRELLAMVEASGHAISHSVYVESHQMHRRDGPVELRSLGETEFANGIAAMSASGNYGPARYAHRIVGTADLRLGDRVGPVLGAHVAAAGERFAGIRMNTAFSEAGLFGSPCDPALHGVLLDPALKAGARVLAKMGLSLDVWCVQDQLGEVAALADAVPDLVIVLDHVGTPERHGHWLGREAEGFADWAAKIGELARRPNMRVKLGGLGMDVTRTIAGTTGSASGAQLARQWRPAIDTCIAAFTPARAMFESNFPPDRGAGSYGATWNAFKIIARGYSETEQDQLFRRTAADTYRIAILGDNPQSPE